MWHLMLTVDLLKHGIPDPSLLTPTYSQANPGQEKENKDNLQELNEEYFASPVFVHTNSDFLGTKFAIYDSQPPFNGAKPSNSRTSRRFGRKQVFPRATGGGTFEIGQVSYEFNLLKSKGPRRMSCTVQCPSSRESIDQPQKSGEIENHAVHSKCMVLKNKSPRWHEHLQCWCLNFHERVTLASVKNFQLVASVDPSQPGDRGDEDTVLLQFEKVGDDLFTMDYREPLSALRASDRS